MHVDAFRGAAGEEGAAEGEELGGVLTAAVMISCKLLGLLMAGLRFWERRKREEGGEDLRYTFIGDGAVIDGIHCSLQLL